MGKSTNKGALLDLLVMLDATGSMGKYIESAKDNIIEICNILQASGRLRNGDGLQIGLLAYRDYDQQSVKVLQPFGFTTDLQEVKNNLATLSAVGGDDLPEAFNTALAHAFDDFEGWRDNSLKVIIAITDAAPHGIRDRDDRLASSEEKEKIPDPLQVARDMAERGYSIFVLGCESQLGKTTEYAIEFYKAISALTQGTYCAITDSRLLAAVIIGLVLERVELRELSIGHREEIRRLIFEEHKSIEDVVEEIHRKLSSQNQQVTSLQTGNIYNDLEGADENYKVFVTSDSLATARKSLKEVRGQRLKDSAMRAVQKSNRAFNNQDQEFTVKVQIKNTGTKIIELQLFDAQNNQLNSLVVKENHIRDEYLRINVPINFVLIRGGHTKNYSTMFSSSDSVLDVGQIYESSS